MHWTRPLGPQTTEKVGLRLVFASNRITAPASHRGPGTAAGSLWPQPHCQELLLSVSPPLQSILFHWPVAPFLECDFPPASRKPCSKQDAQKKLSNMTLGTEIFSWISPTRSQPARIAQTRFALSCETLRKIEDPVDE
jgi:hypothetical protein